MLIHCHSVILLHPFKNVFLAFSVAYPSVPRRKVSIHSVTAFTAAVASVQAASPTADTSLSGAELGRGRSQSRERPASACGLSRRRAPRGPGRVPRGAAVTTQHRVRALGPEDRPAPPVPLRRWPTSFQNSDETLCKFCYSVMIINHCSLKHFSSLEPPSQIILSF